MPGAARIGDIAGGTIITGCFTVMINDIASAKLGSVVTPHPPCPKVPSHCSAVIITASPTVLVGDIQLAREGDSASCGHSITTSSANVRVN
jgi:uncharacterized Zn-binding protein involved in type VI secretion